MAVTGSGSDSFTSAQSRHLTDGRYVAADASGSEMSIWLVDLARRTPTRFGDGVLPVWGPHGSEIVFTYATHWRFVRPRAPIDRRRIE